MLVQELRGEIAQLLAPTIGIRRASLLVVGREAALQSSLVTEGEIDEFLVSNPLFGESVVRFLWLPPGLNPAAVSVDVDDEWLTAFHSAITEWAETNSWLGADEPWAAVGLESSIPSEKVELWSHGHPLIISRFTAAPTTLGIAERLIRKGEDLGELSWKQLELLVAELLDAEGWSVELTPPQQTEE